MFDGKRHGEEKKPPKIKSIRSEQDKREREDREQKKGKKKGSKGDSKVKKVTKPVVKGGNKLPVEEQIGETLGGGNSGGRLEDSKQLEKVKKPSPISFKGIQQNIVDKGVNKAGDMAIKSSGLGGKLFSKVNKKVTGDEKVNFAKLAKNNVRGKILLFLITLVIFLLIWLFISIALFVVLFGAVAIFILDEGKGLGDITGGGSTAQTESAGSGKVPEMPPELVGKFIFPNVARVTSLPGWRFHPRENIWKGHLGIDIAYDTPGKTGHDIYAIATGTVIENKWFGTLGNMVGIEHENGYTSLYGHLKKSYVKVGDTIGLDTPIGEMGMTGGNSSGIHVHLEMFTGGKAGFYKMDNRILPQDYLSCTDTKPMEKVVKIHKECDEYQKKVRGI